MKIASIIAGTAGLRKNLGKKYAIGRIGRKITASAFCEKASPKSPRSSAWRARRVPQPGQWRLVSAFVGHGGKIDDVEGSKIRSAASKKTPPAATSA